MRRCDVVNRDDIVKYSRETAQLRLFAEVVIQRMLGQIDIVKMLKKPGQFENWMVAVGLKLFFLLGDRALEIGIRYGKGIRS